MLSVTVLCWNVTTAADDAATFGCCLARLFFRAYCRLGWVSVGLPRKKLWRLLGLVVLELVVTDAGMVL